MPLETIMLQKQILLTSIENFKKELEIQHQTIKEQNETILNQNDYLVQVIKQNELIKQLAQERKLKRLTAKKKEPLDCLTLEEFYKILFEIISAYKANSYIQSRLRIAFFCYVFYWIKNLKPSYS